MIVFDASAIVSAALRNTRVLARRRFAASISAARRMNILESLARAAIWFDPLERVTDCRDHKDNKYLELAAASRATVIVTGDADLLVLDPWRSVRILRPADYLGKTGRP